MTEQTEQAMKVDVDLVRQLAELLDATALTEIEVEHGDRKIRVARKAAPIAAAHAHYAPAPAPLAVQPAPAAPVLRQGAPCWTPPCSTSTARWSTPTTTTHWSGTAPSHGQGYAGRARGQPAGREGVRRHPADARAAAGGTTRRSPTARRAPAPGSVVLPRPDNAALVSVHPRETSSYLQWLSPTPASRPLQTTAS